MKIENELFLSSFITLFLIRLSIYLSRFFMLERHIMIGQYIFHHFWFSFLFLIFGFLIIKEQRLFKAIIFGIGLGIFADELVFMFFGGGGFVNYWGFPSIIGAIASMIILFIFRVKITKALID